MPREKRPKARSMESLRHAEYYDMQRTFDELYARSQAGEIFDDLMDLILSRENIMLAYRNIKANSGSATPGTDRLRITDIGRLSADEVVARVRKIVNGGRNGYTPRSVRRKEIPKPNGKTRPLGIPCIWDRLIQQCIKQVMEPVCEAKFSSNSYGFRPNRSVENAIAAMYRLMQRSGLYYVVEFDIKGFFDNVDHTKLIRQLWSLNIRDKKLLHVIRRILKAPIQMPDGHLENPKKGTPQGGIISPLLANIVLNELDHWVESQWQNHPVIEKYSYRENAAGCPIHSHAYRAMRNTNLKEMYIVRYEPKPFDQKMTPYTVEGRRRYVSYRAKHKPLPCDRPSVNSPNDIAMSAYAKGRMNFEYYMNREYAYSRDKGKCKCCGNAFSPVLQKHCHHVKNKLPLDRINKVPNLVWLCEPCHRMVHNSPIPPELDAKTVGKIMKYREKLKL